MKINTLEALRQLPHPVSGYKTLKTIYGDNLEYRWEEAETLFGPNDVVDSWYPHIYKKEHTNNYSKIIFEKNYYLTRDSVSFILQQRLGLYDAKINGPQILSWLSTREKNTEFTLDLKHDLFFGCASILLNSMWIAFNKISLLSRREKIKKFKINRIGNTSAEIRINQHLEEILAILVNEISPVLDQDRYSKKEGMIKSILEPEFWEFRSKHSFYQNLISDIEKLKKEVHRYSGLENDEIDRAIVKNTSRPNRHFTRSGCNMLKALRNKLTHLSECKVNLNKSKRGKNYRAASKLLKELLDLYGVKINPEYLRRM